MEAARHGPSGPLRGFLVAVPVPPPTAQQDQLQVEIPWSQQELATESEHGPRQAFSLLSPLPSSPPQGPLLQAWLLEKGAGPML